MPDRHRFQKVSVNLNCAQLFPLLCLRPGGRRVLRTEASGLAGVSPAGAETAAMHGCTARCTASAGEAVGGRSQLPGGNGSRQQNGAYDGCKQRVLTNFLNHVFGLLFSENAVSKFQHQDLKHNSTWLLPGHRLRSRRNSCAKGRVGRFPARRSRKHRAGHAVFLILFLADYLGSGA